jgi:hypothetical protein
VGDPDDRGVVAVVEADDEVTARLRGSGEAGDDRLQFTRWDLARASAAVCVTREPPWRHRRHTATLSHR